MTTPKNTYTIPGIDLSDSQKRLIQNHLRKGEANKAQKIILDFLDQHYRQYDNVEQEH